MNNIFFDDIKNIILNTPIKHFIKLSDDLFDKKYSYGNLYKIISELQSIKKYILYLIHYLKSYKGIKKYDYSLGPETKIKELLNNNLFKTDFNYIFFMNDHMISHNCFSMKGESTRYHNILKYYSKILNKNKLNLLIAKRKLIYSYSLNKYLTNDLIEKISENYIISNNNIIYKKTINENIFMSKRLYISYYKMFDKPNSIYGKSWNFDNYQSYKIFRPKYRIIYILQILPYLLDNHTNDCRCDRCIYNIDFPRIIYLLRHYDNPISGHFSNYFNNHIKFILYLAFTRGINYKNTINKHHYTKSFIFGFPHLKNYKYKHIILKNNKSNWKQLTNLWKMYS